MKGDLWKYLMSGEVKRQSSHHFSTLLYVVKCCSLGSIRLGVVALGNLQRIAPLLSAVSMRTYPNSLPLASFMYADNCSMGEKWKQTQTSLRLPPRIAFFLFLF